MGDIADAMYVQYMNQWRRNEEPAPDPNGERALPDIVPTKWAVLQVLSKNCWMSCGVIEALFRRMSYRRSKASIRRALARCMKFGFVEKQTHHKRETEILKGKRPHRHSKWKLTERGRDVANTPPSKVLKRKKQKETYVHAAKTIAHQSGDRPTEVRVLSKPRKLLGP